MELSDDMTNCQAVRVPQINAYEVSGRSKFDDLDEEVKPEPEPEPSKLN